VLLVNPPEGYTALIMKDLPKNAVLLKAAKDMIDIIQLFTNSKKELVHQLVKLKPFLSPKGIF